MSFLYRVNLVNHEFTKNEERIVEYIKKNEERAINNSVQELAKEMGVSPASIIRLSKKLGYTGLQDLKIDLAKNQNVSKGDREYLLVHSDSLEQMVEKFTSGIENVANKTIELLKKEDIKKAVETLNNAEAIYLMGIGASSIVAQDLQQKLTRVNKRCIYHLDTHMNVAQSAHIKSSDAVIAISYSGETKEVLLAAMEAKRNGAPVIAIVKFGESSLSSIADINLHSLDIEGEIRLGAIYSRYSSLLLTDLLFLGMARENYTEFEGLLTHTRRLTREIR